mgnify:CR=1 FL=1
MTVNVIGGTISEQEKAAYIERAKELYPDRRISQMDITVDGDFVDISYHYNTVPFQRIRRITGYLVGTLDRFNNAKAAEVRDRVKHGLGCEDCEDVYM